METPMYSAPSAQVEALCRIRVSQLICFSYLGNTMDFRNPLTKLRFETLLKFLSHLQGLSEYILLPYLSLIISSHLVSFSFCFILFKRVKIVVTRKLAEIRMCLQFILRPLEIEFVSHTNSHSFSLCTFYLRYSLSSIFFLEKSHENQWSKSTSGAKI